MPVRLLLRGTPPALEAALDVLHVQAEVLGVEERDGACEVWLERPAPDAVARLGAVAVSELPITADLFAHTGLEHDAPVLVAPDLCVRPPWVVAPAGFVGTQLVVPRGSAFGSGEHASTRAALLALHAAWPPRTVDVLVDVGTGSGILALYGAQRGARALFACDIEGPAARAAAELVPGLGVACGGPEVLAVAADVLIANMTAAELAATLPELVRLWRRTELFVLSGLRGDAQVEDCCAALRRFGFGTPARRDVEAFTALTWRGAPAG
jgi:ribosomal protein L11 methylase PrmA